MDSLYEFLGQHQMWNFAHYSGRKSLDVTEFWVTQGAATLKVQNRTVSAGEHDSWLQTQDRVTEEGSSSEATSSSSPSCHQNLLARFIWVDGNIDTKEVDISKATEEYLMDQLDLKLAYKYAKSVTTGIYTLPEKSVDGYRRQAFVLCYWYKLAAIWSYSRPEDQPQSYGLCSCIVFTQTRNKLHDKLPELSFDSCVGCSFSLPAYLLSILLIGEINTSQSTLREGLVRIEELSGQDGFSSRDQKSVAPDQLPDESLKAHGIYIELVSMKQESQTIKKLVEFMLQAIHKESSRGSAVGGDLLDIKDFEADSNMKALEHHVDVLFHSLEMQGLDIEHLIRRIEIQVKALIQMIAERDMLRSHRMTQLSADDAATAKGLMMIAMLFAPGSLVSSLFSTDVFNWDGRDLTSDDIKLPTTPQLTLYWVITLPLTIATFALYFSWVALRKPIQQKLEDAVTSTSLLLASMASGLLPLSSIAAKGNDEPKNDILTSAQTLVQRRRTFVQRFELDTISRDTRD